MPDLIVRADASHLPDYYGDTRRYFGLVATATPVNLVDDDDLEKNVAAAMSVWNWTWHDFAVCKITTTKEMSGAEKVDAVYLLDATGIRIKPEDTAPMGAATAINEWLSDRFEAYAAFATRNGGLLKAVEQTPEEIAKQEDAPPWVLGFVANLTEVMAPVPQIGQLAHVAYADPKLLPEPGMPNTYLAFVPLFDSKWHELEVELDHVKDAIDGERFTPKSGEDFLGTLTITVPSKDGKSKIELRCAAIPSDAPADVVEKKTISPATLWSTEVDLRVGARRAGLRGLIGAGFELLDPGLRGLDDFALLPDPDAAFDVAALLVRDHVLPTVAESPDARPRVLERLLSAVAFEGGDAESLFVDAYRTYWKKTLASPRAWADAVRAASPAVAEAWGRRPKLNENPGRTVAPQAEPGFPAASVSGLAKAKVVDGKTEWELIDVVLEVDAPRSKAKHYLEHWNRAARTWTAYKDDTDKPFELSDVGDPKSTRLTLEITDIARRGLRAGRHQIRALDVPAPKSIVTRLLLPADEATLAPARQLASALADDSAHVDLVIGLLRAAAGKTAVARDYLARIEAELRRDAIAREATRSAIRDDAIRDDDGSQRITKAMLDIEGADGGSFVEQLRGYYAALLELSSLPIAVERAVTDAFEEHGVAHLQTILRAGDGITATPAPFEIELRAPVEDASAFDDPRKPENDPFDRVAGAAALFRRKGDKTWRCLNAARLALVVKGKTKATLDGIAPMPIAYEDGVATAALRYDGVPIAITSPVARTVDEYSLESSDDLGVPKIAEYSFIDDNKLEWARPPMLAFGKSYEACGFVVDQSGALPKAVANKDAPWLLDPTKLEGALGGVTATVAEYLRTVPIAGPRLQAQASSRPEFGALVDPVFQVPAGVTPLARELPRAGVTAGGPPRIFFRSGATGTLDLTGGAWTLVLDGIEARGFMGSGTLVVTLADDQPGADQRRVSLLVTVSTRGVAVRVRIKDDVIELIGETSIAGPTTVELTFLPDSVSPGKPHRLHARVLPADADGATSKEEEKELEPSQAALFLRSRAFLKVSTEEVMGDGTPASISFGAPRLETQSGTAGAEAGEAPVILLTTSPESFASATLEGAALRVRPPAVDQACWDRRAAAAQIDASTGPVYERLKQHRGNVHAGWLIGLEASEHDAVDLGLDDPSVRAVLIEAIPLFARKEAQAVRKVLPLDASWDQEPEVPKTLADLLLGARLQDAHLPVIKIGDIAVDTPAAVVLPKEGEVWEVSVRALVSAVVVNGVSELSRLSKGAESLLEHVPGSAEWHAGPAQRVLVETATTSVPSFESLRAALQPDVVGRSVAVGLAPGRLVAAGYLAEDGWAWRGRLFGYLREATLARQVWRWTGRPLDAYPFEAAEGYKKLVDLSLLSQGTKFWAAEITRIGKALAWEVKAFGDRDQADFVSTSHVLKPMGRTDLRRELLDGDGRAQHWRFRLAARSRYAPIIRALRAREVSTPAKGKDAPLHDLWQRALVPAALPDVIEPPSVRVVLPMTESAGGLPHRAAPLLLVLDDPWFDVGGLAEEIVVELDEARDVAVEPNPAITLQELGPDPIRTKMGWSRNGKGGTFEPGPEVIVRPVGPVGYTYDEGTSAPRFAHSSFILEAEAIDGTPVPDWTFVKLSFRRRIAPEALSGWMPPSNVLSEGSTRVYAADPEGRPGCVDLDIVPDATHVVALQLDLRVTTRALPFLDVRVGQDAKLRVAVERVSIRTHPTDKTLRLESWRVDVFPRGDGGPTAGPRLTRVREIPVPVPSPGDAKARNAVSVNWSSAPRPDGERSSSAVGPIGVTCWNGTALFPYAISKPTPARWAQLAADFSRFAELDAAGAVLPNRSVRADDLTAVQKDGRWRFVPRADNAGAKPVLLGPYDAPDPDAQLTSLLWVVATERVLDAGRRPTERYVALFRIQPGQADLEPLESRGEPSGGEMIFRILEIEQRQDDAKKDMPTGTPWNLLWPLEPEGQNLRGELVADAIARIVKVSRPISSGSR